MQNYKIMEPKDVYEDLFSNLRIGLISLVFVEESNQFQVEHINAGFTNMTGYTLEDINVQFNGRFSQIIHKDDRKQVGKKHDGEMIHLDNCELEYRIVCKDGRVIWVLHRGRINIDDNNRMCYQGVLIDITDAQQQAEEIKATKERFRIAIESSSVCIFEMDLVHLRFTYLENTEKIFGVSVEKILKDILSFSTLSRKEYIEAIAHYFSHPEDKAVIAEAFKKIKNGVSTSYEARMKAGDSRFIWCKIDLTPILNKSGVPSRMIGKIADIDSLMKEAHALKAQAKRDLYTGLYNKFYTEFLIEKTIKESNNKQHAFIILDLDDFKHINDTYGHAYGDIVLKKVSNKLKKLFRKGDIIGRIGGDEFIIFMKDIDDVTTVKAKVEELLKSVSEIVFEENSTYNLTVSVGVSITPYDGGSYKNSYMNADTALYESKRIGKNTFTIYKEVGCF